MGPHTHRTHRSGLLRAGVLGANDGVLSIASLILGVTAAHMSQAGILVAGIAGLVGGALSMGAGEYVSVSSQADTERADLEIERKAIDVDSDSEHQELRDIYVHRGLAPELATQVAQQLMTHDALGAHARDDIGITDALTARPLQAAAMSCGSFAIGGIVPLTAEFLAPAGHQISIVMTVSLLFLAALGGVAARAGGASIVRGAARVLIWGVMALSITGAAGALFGAAT